MKKFAFATTIALALATTAYAADHGGRGGGPGGGGGSGGMSTMSPGPGGGGPGGHPGGFSNSMGPNQGLSGLHNQSPMTNTYKNNGGNYGHFTEGNHHNMYNYGGKNFENGESRHFEGGHDHHGVVSGNFFEHGRHFRFRRFFNGEWVFLNAWNDCTAYVWVNVAPGTWAWAPINICVG